MKGLGDLLAGAAAAAIRRPAWTLGACGALVAASVLSGLGMRFRNEVTDMVPASSAPLLARLEEVFGASDNAFLLARAEGTATSRELIAFADDCARRLEGDPDVRAVSSGFHQLAERLTAGGVLALAPLFAGPAELADLDRLLTPAGLAERLRAQSLRLGLPGLGEAEKWIERDPLELRNFIVKRLAAGEAGFRFRPGSLRFLAEDGRSLLIRIEGRARHTDLARVKPLVARIRTAAREAGAEIERATPGARIATGLTGGYAFAVESEATLRSDLTGNLLLSPAIVLLLAAYALRRPLLIAPAAAVLVAGMVLGFGLFSLFRRDMVTLAMVSGAILAGLGIDFITHVALRAFAGPSGASRAGLVGAVRDTGPALVFETLATAGAFLSFLLTGEKFLADVGLLSACGLVTICAAALLVLPPLLLPWARRAEAAGGLPPRPPRDLGAARLAAFAARKPGAILAVSAAVALGSASALFWKPPGLEDDLRNLNARRSEAIAVQDRIAGTFGGGSDPVLVVIEAEPDGARGAAAGRDPPREELESLALADLWRLEPELDRLVASGVIAGWSSPALLIPPAVAQERALALLRGKEPAALSSAFVEALDEEGFAPERFDGAVAALRAALERREPFGAGDVRQAGLGAEIDRMLGAREARGYGLAAVYPAGAFWRAGEQAAVFTALERALVTAGVRGRIAGLHAVSRETADAVVGQFLKVSACAAVVVTAIVAVLFRRPTWTALALLPVGLGTLATAAIAGLIGLKLNFMNVGVIPMVLGIGVDSGIHLVRRYLDLPERDAAEAMRSAGPGILLASLTTIAAFGTIGFSANRGIASVGLVSGIGTTACLIASVVTLPAALEAYGRRRRAGRRR